VRSTLRAYFEYASWSTRAIATPSGIDVTIVPAGPRKEIDIRQQVLGFMVRVPRG